MVTMVTCLRLTKVICHHSELLMKHACVCVCVVDADGPSCFSSVCNIDRPCNEFLVPPPPQFEPEVVCVCLCVLTAGK